MLSIQYLGLVNYQVRPWTDWSMAEIGMCTEAQSYLRDFWSLHYIILYYDVSIVEARKVNLQFWPISRILSACPKLFLNRVGYT